MSTIDPTEIVNLIEIRGIYDGWSVAEMRDGSYLNRWDATIFPARHAATQTYIDGMKVTL